MVDSTNSGGEARRAYFTLVATGLMASRMERREMRSGRGFKRMSLYALYASCLANQWPDMLYEKRDGISQILCPFIFDLQGYNLEDVLGVI